MWNLKDLPIKINCLFDVTHYQGPRALLRITIQADSIVRLVSQSEARSRLPHLLSALLYTEYYKVRY